MNEKGHAAATDFTRRVLTGWSFTLLLGFLGSQFLARAETHAWVWPGLAGVILLMILSRKVWLGQLGDRVVSAVGAPLAATLIAVILAEHGDLPVWGFPLAAIGCMVYILLCGRDLSFAGLAVLGSAATGVAAAAAAAVHAIPSSQVLPGWLVSVALLTYLAYDMAMILRRRRMNEVVPAVADFYRDLFNWVTYPAKVVHHWMSYRFEPMPPLQAGASAPRREEQS